MKYYLLTIAVFTLANRCLNIPVNAQDLFDRGLTQSQLQQTKSLSLDLAQNTETSPQSAEEYFKRSLDYIRSSNGKKKIIGNSPL